mmetsp:Transcript_15431/g.23278  ORF Transcript_15431/g.23278 Transcript_15431/m.23278 type:complete len:1352 (+) Transcript_15431:169-4224(+)|eukprot:CAMPEP_0185023726 /NCGR_PEP_ID=MMETSP1103-20130426/6363_1 /TAXON_ID=36769 /ORGANISM="Paraphysomonas bandaiensis, Strain Caron Lab Isolate" /LENGTH=1351 /DNA_ID=CAMNT_0027556453 /DNA_START=124 /DNA_END=4179 /DNA_ORIENTATION=+
MLGLRSDTDSAVRSLTSINNTKSFRFAERNVGRFHTSGVSGGMKKHTSLKTKSKKKGSEDSTQSLQVNPVKKYVPDRIEVRQKEIEEDTKQLLALEAKLAEIKRQKELRRAREEARRINRLQYKAAVIVQRVVSRFLHIRNVRAAMIIQDYLKHLAYKNALMAASWGASVIRKFAIKATHKRYYQLSRERAIKLTTIQTWMLIEKLACSNVAIVRDASSRMLTRVLDIGTRTASLCIAAAKKKKLTGRASNKGHSQSMSSLRLKRAGRGGPKARAGSYRLARGYLGGHLKFNDPSYRHKRIFTDGWYNPANKMNYAPQSSTDSSPCRNDSPSSSFQSPQGKGMFVTQSSPSLHNHATVCRADTRDDDKLSKTNIGNEMDPDEEKAIRLAMLHRQQEEKRKLEAANRLKLIEEHKRHKEAIEKLRREAIEREKMRKDGLKKEFMERIVTQQMQRAKVVNQLREKRKHAERKRQELEHAERENAKMELKLMFAEDIRFEQNLEKQRKKNAAFKLDLSGLNADVLKRKHSLASARSGKNTSKGKTPRTARGGSVDNVSDERDLENNNSTEAEKEKYQVQTQRKAESQKCAASRVAAEKEDRVRAALVEEMKKNEHRMRLEKLKSCKSKPKQPVLSAEEEAAIALEKERKEKERARQQALREAALKKRVAARIAAEKEEKERAALAEEIKKKEMEMITLKASRLVKQQIKRRKELIKQAKKQTKNRAQETNSAHAAGSLTRNAKNYTGSAPGLLGQSPVEKQSTGFDWNLDDVLDPLNDSNPHGDGEAGAADTWGWHNDPKTHESTKDSETSSKGSLSIPPNTHFSPPAPGTHDEPGVTLDKLPDIRRSASRVLSAESRTSSRHSSGGRSKCAARSSSSATNADGPPMVHDEEDIPPKEASTVPTLPSLDPSRGVMNTKPVPAVLQNSPFLQPMTSLASLPSAANRPSFPSFGNVAANKSKESKKVGKVSSILSMVEKARRKLKVDESDPGTPRKEPINTTQTSSPTKVVNGASPKRISRAAVTVTAKMKKRKKKVKKQAPQEEVAPSKRQVAMDKDSKPWRQNAKIKKKVDGDGKKGADCTGDDPGGASEDVVAAYFSMKKQRSSLATEADELSLFDDDSDEECSVGAAEDDTTNNKGSSHAHEELPQLNDSADDKLEELSLKYTAVDSYKVSDRYADQYTDRYTDLSGTANRSMMFEGKELEGSVNESNRAQEEGYLEDCDGNGKEDNYDEAEYENDFYESDQDYEGGDDEGPEGGDEAPDEEDDYERLLNLECERLRAQLEEKIYATQEWCKDMGEDYCGGAGNDNDEYDEDQYDDEDGGEYDEQNSDEYAMDYEREEEEMRKLQLADTIRG